MNFHTHTVAGYSKSLHYAIFVIVVQESLHSHYNFTLKK